MTNLRLHDLLRGNDNFFDKSSYGLLGTSLLS